MSGILAGGAAKSGLTMANKDFMKMNRGAGGSGARSQTGRSQNSRGTRRSVGSRSRRT